MLVEDLRIGQQQLVEIAKAVSLDARILIMDEPTSALSAAEVEVLFQVIADLKAPGRGDRLHLPPAGRADPHRRLHHRAARRPDHRPRAMVRNVDTPWIVRQMIGSDAKDFAKAGDHKPGAEVFRAEDDLPAARDRRPCRRPRLAVAAGRRDPRHLRPDGRRPQRAVRLHHGPARAGDGQDLHRRRAGQGTRRDRPDPPRPGADPGGPPARRAGADPVGGQQSDARQPAQIRPLASTSAARPRRAAVRAMVKRTGDQGRRSRHRGHLAVAAATSRRWSSARR